MSPSHRPRARRRLGLLGASLALAGGAALGAGLPAAGAAADDPADRPPSLLAKVAPGADAADIAGDNGLTLARSFPELGWVELEVPEGDPLAAARDLLKDGRVFRLDYQRRGESLETDLTPRDPFTSNPLTTNQGIVSDYHWRQANFFAAWDVTRGSSAVKVAVVDSEFDTEHPDLRNKFATGYNAERQTGPYRSSNVRASDQQIQEANANPDNNSLHGTHVAGLVAAATDNLIGVSGAGFDTVVLPVKVSLNFQVGDTADAKFVGDAVEGIRWAADNGAHIINMSFGTARYHQALADAVAYAAGKGVLLVAAAGNTQGDPQQRGTIHYPAGLDAYVLAVAATDPNNAVTDFSTNGNFVDVAAPGFQILSTWDLRAPGIILGNGQAAPYRFLNGTSMASPIVAGLAALMKGVRPDLTAGEIASLIMTTATDVGAQGRDPQFGAGIINADAAVRAAQAYVRPVAPQPVVAPRKRVRIFYSCTVDQRKVKVGKPGRLGVRKGARLSCKGRTAPALRRVQIEIQRFAARGGWKRIGKVKTNNRGRFGFTVRLRTVGNWTVRAAYAGNAALLPAGSLGAKVLVATRR
jgi:subtilisin family serine protease